MLNLTDYTKSQNLSTSFYPDTGVVSSTLTYVPGLGDNGILVGMGGTQMSSTAPARSNGTMVCFRVPWAGCWLTQIRSPSIALTSSTLARSISVIQLADGTPKIPLEKYHCLALTHAHSLWLPRTTQVITFIYTGVGILSLEKCMTISIF